MAGSRRKILGVALGWGALALASRAHAGNDDGILLGNDAALVGGAVVTTVDDGSALWYNPAGLALSTKDSVDVGASAFALRAYKMPHLIAADGGSGGNAQFTEIVTIPSAVTYVRRFTPNLVGGLGLFASQVGDFTLRTSLDVPFSTVHSNISVLLGQQTSRYHLAFGLGAKLAHNLTVGVSVLGDYYYQSSITQASGQTTDATGAALLSQSTSAFEQEKILGAHMRLGVTWEALDGLRLGATVQTAGAYVYRSDHVTGFESSTAPNADGTLMLTANHTDSSKSQGDVGRYAPWRFKLGGAYRLPNGGTVSLEGDVQNRLKNLTVDVDRVFVWNVRAGIRMPVGKQMHLGAGLFTDRGAYRKDMYGAGNIDFYGFTLGGQYDHIRWIADEGPDDPNRPAKRAPLTFSSTVALRYAYGLGKLAGQYLPAPDYNAVTRAVSINVHEITLHLGSGVYF